MRMNVAIVDIATKELLQKIHKRFSVDAVVYRKIENAALPGEFPDIRWFDFSADLAASIRYGFQQVREKLEVIRKANPAFFKVNGYDFFEALNKDLFWARFNELLADYAYSKIDPPEKKIVYDYRRTLPMRGWLAVIAFVPVVLRDFFRKNPTLPLNKTRGKVAIRVNHPGVLPLLGKLPDVLGPENIFFFCTTNSRSHQISTKYKITDLTDAAPLSSWSLLSRIREAITFAGIREAPLFLR
ncbi:MAG TPA: hypothetical protein VI731_06225, partial [Bacteroidia bacterium]|nr:hypothetical protein [Bacteroidia bacterium]